MLSEARRALGDTPPSPEFAARFVASCVRDATPREQRRLFEADRLAARPEGDAQPQSTLYLNVFGEFAHLGFTRRRLPAIWIRVAKVAARPEPHCLRRIPLLCGLAGSPENDDRLITEPSDDPRPVTRRSLNWLPSPAHLLGNPGSVRGSGVRHRGTGGRRTRARATRCNEYGNVTRAYAAVADV